MRWFMPAAASRENAALQVTLPLLFYVRAVVVYLRNRKLRGAES